MISSAKSTGEPPFAAFVAIDWADKKHVWSVQPAGSNERQRGEIDHSPEAIESWVAMLCSRFRGQLALAVEQSRGALVFMLSKYEQLHVYPIHPRAAAQFRAALFPSGAKDDPIDADLLLDLLVHHRTHLRRLSPDTEQTRLIQHLVEERRKLVNEKTRQCNRLTAKLKLYFPHVLDWFEAIDSPLVGAFLQKWPTLEALQRARAATVRCFLTGHNCRSRELIDKRLDQIRQAVPAIRDPAVINSSVTMTKILVDVIAAVRAGIATFDRQIEQAAAAHPDFAIFESFPGAGPVLAPRLLAASAPKEIAMARPQTCSSLAGSRQSSNEAASPNGSTSAGPARSSCGRRSTNGLVTPSLSATGRVPAMISTVNVARVTTPPSEYWPSSGFASRFVAGRTPFRMTTLDTYGVCASGVHLSWMRSPIYSHPTVTRLTSNAIDWNHSDDC